MIRRELRKLTKEYAIVLYTIFILDNNKYNVYIGKLFIF